MKNPIRVFYSPLSRRFYASQYYKRINDHVVEITGAKFDVTDDIAQAVIKEEIQFTKTAETTRVSCDMGHSYDAKWAGTTCSVCDGVIGSKP